MKIILNIARLTVVVGLSYNIFISIYALSTVRVDASEVAPQPVKIKHQFFDLVIKGKFAISDLQAAVKSVVYNEDFKQSTIEIGGMRAYEANISNSRAALEKRTSEVKSAQQAIVKFFNSHPEFIKSLTPEVSSQAQAIVKLNIPAQTKLWSNEQRLLNRQCKCNGSTIHPKCI